MGYRTAQVTIAIFPVTTATICPAAVSQTSRTPLVANTDLLLRAAAMSPPPTALAKAAAILYTAAVHTFAI